MDMSAIKDIEQAVLALPVEQRVQLAESLLDSLPLTGDEWSEEKELAEVERRERQIESGEAQPIPETDFWKRVEARRRK
jgi:putative addiction module component (TIGR02574 family)